MKHRSRYGAVDPKHPEAAGVCDRGGEVRKRRELLPEMHYVGGRLEPNGLLVCRDHMDIPNPQFGGPERLRPDPVPVKNPRPMTDDAGPLAVERSRRVLRNQYGVPLRDSEGNILMADA